MRKRRSMSLFRTTFVLALLLAMASQISLASPNSQHIDPLLSQQELSGEKVQRFDHSRAPVLRDSWVEVFQGRMNEEGDCTYAALSLETAKPGEVGVVRLRAVDRVTCVYEVEKGYLDYLPEPDYSKGTGDYSEDSVHGPIICSEEDEAKDACPEPGDGASMAPNQLALVPGQIGEFDPVLNSHNNLTYMFQTAWEDPVYLQVNLVRTASRTHTSGSTITSGDCSRYRWKLSWWRISDTPPFDFYACEFGGWYVATARSGHFYTDAFPNCGFVHTYTDTNVAEARLTYGLGWVANVWASGDWCKNLLWWTTYSSYDFYPASP